LASSIEGVRDNGSRRCARPCLVARRGRWRARRPCARACIPLACSRAAAAVRR